MCEDGRREEIENRLLFAHFHETCFLSTDFLKIHKIKFHEYRSCGSRVVLCRRTDRQTDMTKLIVAFHNSANAPKKEHRRPQPGTKVAKDRFVLCAFRGLTK